MHIPHAICADCKIEMVISRGGALYEMLASWGSYYKVYADEWECADCGRIVALPARKVATVHLDNEYGEWLAEVTAHFAV